MSAGPARGESERNLALDFTKGALVLFMVLYHWINYFVSTEGFLYTYIRFVTASFIFITGFLIASVYLPKFQDPGKHVLARLMQRGLKLLALFTVLNLAASLVVARNYNGRQIGVQSFLDNAPSIYGLGKGESAAFEILVPISYLLVISSFALITTKWFRYSLQALCVLMFLGVFILGTQGISSPNLYMVAVGTLGMAFGVVPLETINQLAAKWKWILAVYLLYAAAITEWGTPYPLQTVGALLSVLVIYAIAAKCGSGGPVQRHIILLGQYSLVAYIVQIAALQILRRLLAGIESNAIRWPLSFVGVILLTSGMVCLAVLIKSHSRIADRLYRFVFG